MYVMYRRYKCHQCNISITGLQLLETLPGIYKAQFPAIETKGSASSRLIHNTLVSLILFDALTAKTFAEMGQSIANCRMEEYLDRRCLFVYKYDSILQ